MNDENRIYCKNKFHLVLCEIYNKHIHGDFEENDVHYLTLYKFNFDLNSSDINEDEDSEDEDSVCYSNLFEVKNIAKYFTKQYQKMKRRSDYFLVSQHPIIRNYKQLIESPNYFKPEIGECVYLKNGTCVCILKTFWIRIIQRAWKKVFLERKKLWIKRMFYSSIFHRELHGNWPKSCGIMPGIKGLLSAK